MHSWLAASILDNQEFDEGANMGGSVSAWGVGEVVGAAEAALGTTRRGF